MNKFRTNNDASWMKEDEEEDGNEDKDEDQVKDKDEDEHSLLPSKELFRMIAKLI